MFCKLDVRHKSIVILALSKDNCKTVLKYSVNSAPALYSQSHLDKVINANEVSVLVVAKLPLVSMSNQSVRNILGLGKVDHPDANLNVVADYQQRTANDLHTNKHTHTHTRLTALLSGTT